jgi:hypothetical protein
MRIQTLRDSVEAATERVRERVDNIRVRLNSHDLNVTVGDYSSSTTGTQTVATLRRNASRTSNGIDLDSASLHNEQCQNREPASSFELDETMDATTHTVGSLHSPLFPMVVLPGMPSRALPIFQVAPLRWLAVPIIDIMDSHKKNLAKQHDGEVLFVDAPSVEDITAYSSQSGSYWEEEMDDKVLFNLRGIKRKQARRIEADMEAYFSKKGQPSDPELLPLRRRHQCMFSADGVHPNDRGYDFWGRYIAHAIVDEWQRKQLDIGSPSNFI